MARQLSRLRQRAGGGGKGHITRTVRLAACATQQDAPPPREVKL